MKYSLGVLFCIFSLSFIACGDDDDDFFNEFEEEFEELDNESSSSKFSKKSSSSTNVSYSSEEEEAPLEQVSRTFIEFHYDSSRKATIATDKINDAITNYVYRTTQVGQQVWLGENVRRSARTAKCYEEKDNYCTVYGSLYASSSGLCPADFKVPTLDEWNQLLKIAGGTSQLMSKTLWEDAKGNAIQGKDAVGFSMLPGGLCAGDDCSGIHTEANFFAQKGDTRGYVTFKPGKDSLEWHPINENDFVHVSLRCVQPATKVQNFSELTKVCEPSTNMEVVEKGFPYKCTQDSAWAEIRDSLPKSCPISDNGKRYISKSKDYICIAGRIDTIPAIVSKFGFCAEKNDKDTVQFLGSLYVCESLDWKKKTIEDLYGKCKGSSHNVVKYIDKDYRCRDTAWSTLTEVEKEHGFCTNDMEGDTISTTNHTLLVNSPITTITYFVCKNSEWVKCETNEDYFGQCTPQRQGEIGSYNIGALNLIQKNSFLCDNGVWRFPSGRENRQGFCTNDIENKVVLDSGFYFICKNGAWVEPSIEEFPVTCNKDHIDSIYKTMLRQIVCDVDSLKWRELSFEEKNLGLCTKNNEGTVGQPSKSVKSFKICKDHKWIGTDSLNYYLGYCSTETNYKEIKTHRNKKEYYCNGEKWVMAVLSDILGSCTSENAKDTARYKDTLYICHQNEWKKATRGLILGYCESSNEGTVMYDFLDQTHYVCKYYTWKTASMNDIETCTESKYGVVKKMPQGDPRVYVCSDLNVTDNLSEWRKLSPEEEVIGACTPASSGLIKEYNGNMLICLPDPAYGAQHYWESASKNDVVNLACSSASNGTKVRYASQNNICDGKGGWTVEYGSININGVTHKTVEFAGLTLFAENLKIPNGNSKCFEGNNNKSCEHGMLYQFSDAQELCPTGWHLIDTVEYKAIIDTALIYSGYLRSINIYDTDNSAWQAPSSGKNLGDNYGINIYGIGYCDATGKCDNNMRDSYLWMNLAVNQNTAKAVHLSYERTYEIVNMNTQAYLSVRCVKDH